MAASGQEEKRQNKHRLQAEEYLRKHRIMELFEDLCTAISYKKPENVEDFLVEQLELRKKNGIHLPIFNHDEIVNIFNLFDLKQKGEISNHKCREALKSMANSQNQHELVEKLENIPLNVNLEQFKALW